MKQNLFLDLSHFPKQGCKIFLVLFLAVFSVTLTEAKNFATEIQQSSVKGVVQDSLGVPLVGATLTIKGSSVSTQTNAKGEFSFPTLAKNFVLTVTFTGYLSEDIVVGEVDYLKIVLKEDPNEIGEVVVVAFGQQKKETLVGSITSVNPKELKGPTSNLTTMLAGRVAGVIAYQRSGEPGQDNAQFFIRGVTSFGTGKVDPLILLNGMEISSNELARIQPDDIEGFSILKDASAAALYGARGANGVILVTTKKGKEGPTKFNVRVENSISGNTKNFKLADNITYMTLANEGARTRDYDEPYAQSKIDMTELGRDPYLYPNNNWIDMLVRDYTNNMRYNGNISGGGAKAQYYISGTANIDNGVIRKVETQNFNSNVKASNYEMRSNVNFKLSPTTDAAVRTQGQFYEYNGPIGGGSAIFNQAIWSNPVVFPAYFPKEMNPLAKHVSFGNARRNDNSFYNNPYANAVSGYQLNERSYVTVQGEIKQDLEFLVKGLTGRIMGYTRRNSEHALTRRYNPFYYAAVIDRELGYTGLQLLNEGVGTEYLNYSEGKKIVDKFNYVEAALNYNTEIGKNNLGATLIYLASHYQTANAGSLQNSLPKRNQGISGRFTYGYDSRYLAEFNFGYNGSERFWDDQKYGFFPSVGLAWNIHNEPFFNSLSSTINKLKLRGTYGLVGNDQIGNDENRFFFLSNVNLNSTGYSFGYNYDYTRPGVAVTRYENKDITWEKSYKSNLGFELGVNNNWNIEFDVYRELRTNILMTRSYIPSEIGLTAAIQANVGKAKAQGFEVATDYTKSFQNDMFLTLRGNFTYATTIYEEFEEPDYLPENSHLTRKGTPISQTLGYIAERLFIDDYEVANSPTQFGSYLGGDIKYRDVNGDGVITTLDRVPIGKPTTPEAIYGFGFTFGYNNFDLSSFFQGSLGSSFFINPTNITPFANDVNTAYTGTQNGLLQVIADSHWSESNKDVYAFFPRLSTDLVTNNTQTSTWWMRDGAFLRLKSIELGYNFSDKLLNKYKVSNLRVYANGANLLSWSRFKLWDVEMGGNGLGYPIQRVFNVGVSVGF
ncbi:SusC/RagA family TonB-linked outer membrane protein [Sphingobacterium bovistauri]|uniref:TonB-dependent receptor n=1 Tax=Sphingobacterium bovistauri TaxID=2781959 RepID=A0ABS7Z9B1_9SPHI|nr:TonB-dependent receptor [Sphingobacterium bovistauri]MCA5005455.1 TonB-dependent receptor [Sphingobacterium bovistauri]